MSRSPHAAEDRLWRDALERLRALDAVWDDPAARDPALLDCRAWLAAQTSLPRLAALARLLTPELTRRRFWSVLVPVEREVARCKVTDLEVLDADLPDEALPWMVRQILHWTFDHPYAETALQFALAPDATLLAYTHLRVSPEDEAPTVMESIHTALDQAEDAWGQILVDALLKDHLEERVPAGEPSALAA